MMEFNRKVIFTIQKFAISQIEDNHSKALEVYAINIFSYFMDIKPNTPIAAIKHFHRCDDKTANALKTLQLSISEQCEANLSVPDKTLRDYVNLMIQVIENQWALNSKSSQHTNVSTQASVVTSAAKRYSSEEKTVVKESINRMLPDLNFKQSSKDGVFKLWVQLDDYTKAENIVETLKSNESVVGAMDVSLRRVANTQRSPVILLENFKTNALSGLPAISLSDVNNASFDLS